MIFLKRVYQLFQNVECIHEFRYIVNGEWMYAKDKEININGNHEVILNEYQLIEYE